MASTHTVQKLERGKHRPLVNKRVTKIAFLPCPNKERNHQGLEDKIIHPEFQAFPVEGKVCCCKRLGGLLRYYFREAA